MPLSRSTIRPLVLLIAVAGASAAASAQSIERPPSSASAVGPAPVHRARHPRTQQAAYNPNLIVLDPAHGGPDLGASLGKAGQEKDFTFAFAQRLKTLLETQQFTVVLTHASADDDPTQDQRAETINRSRPVACLLLHATAAGHGVHLFTSSLTAPFFSGDLGSDTSITPWDSAQAPTLPRSLQLVNELSTALNSLRVPLLVSRVSVNPIDSLTCPAVAVEMAPTASGTSLADDAYQQHIAQSLVTALTYWRQHAMAQIAASQSAAQAANPPASTAPATTPKPKTTPKPRPVNPPDESPLAPETTPLRPAPIERRPPPVAPNGGRP